MRYHINAINMHTGDVELVAKINKKGDALMILDCLNKSNTTEHLVYDLDKPFDEKEFYRHANN